MSSSVNQPGHRRRGGRVGVMASSSSRVDIAPQRRRDPPLSQPETVRRLPTAAVDADRYRLVGHYGLRRMSSLQHWSTGRAGRYGPGKTRRGRAAESNQGSRAFDEAVISSTRNVILFQPFLRTSRRPTRPTGLRQHHGRHSNSATPHKILP